MKVSLMTLLLAGSYSLGTASYMVRGGEGAVESTSHGRELFFGWWNKPKCPKVEPVGNFDLNRFIEKSWFVQKQQPNPYQGPENLFCVVATYEKRDDQYLSVRNYGNNNEVNGPVRQSGDGGWFSDLCALPKEDGKGELGVAPCFFARVKLFNLVDGPYWVVALDDNYEWAIISGGPPNVVRSKDPLQCTTKIGSGFFDTNGSGLWLFTRAKTGPAAQEATAKMLQILQEKGIFAGDLLDVDQEGCLYQDALIKA